MDRQETGYLNKVMELDLSDIPKAAKIHKALASELRLQILRVGLSGGYCVGEIAEMLHIPASTAALNAFQNRRIDYLPNGKNGYRYFFASLSFPIPH